uniref:Bm11103 n=1 Tax=Brugia malayi TaxID=6279 RepID=A0A0H5SCR3_BRUMA|nr:Bm11103 [Brugia malayi]
MICHTNPVSIIFDSELTFQLIEKSTIIDCVKKSTEFDNNGQIFEWNYDVQWKLIVTRLTICLTIPICHTNPVSIIFDSELTFQLIEKSTIIDCVKKSTEFDNNGQIFEW